MPPELLAETQKPPVAFYLDQGLVLIVHKEEGIYLRLLFGWTLLHTAQVGVQLRLLAFGKIF